MSIYKGNNKIGKLVVVKGNIDYIYPIGSIYMNTNNMSPGDIFGGEWEEIQGRFLLGRGEYDSTHSYDAGTTVGSPDAVVVSHTHTFTGKQTDTAGAHTHSYNVLASTGVGSSYEGMQWAGTHKDDWWGTTGSAGGHSHSVSGTISSTGVSEKDKNLPQSLVVYIWKRVA